MIKIDVRPYCHDCAEFEPDIEKPEIAAFCGYGSIGRCYSMNLKSGDFIIRCKYENRCRHIENYLERKREGKI